MGLGDAMRRLQRLDAWYERGLDKDGKMAKERDLLLSALNHIPVELPIACFPQEVPEDLDGDGAVSFFEAAAATSCCRIPTPDGSRAQPTRKAASRAR